MPNNITILFIADIVGRVGRRLVSEKVEYLRKKFEIDFIIANGENAAGGIGLTSDIAFQLFQNGVDVITSGNHIWEKKEIYPSLDREKRILRPLNYPEQTIGHGFCVMEREGASIAVVNLEGRHFMRPVDCPFQALNRLISSLKKQTNCVIVDFHAESTAEKQALANYFDGRVSAVLGTHTHVQTADEQILPGGTAYITDVGMTGAYRSIIGFDIPSSVSRFVSMMPVKLNPAKEDPRLQGVILSIDPQTGKGVRIQRLSLIKE